INPNHYQDIDVVLVSHLHMDHLDLPSIHMLNPETPIILPKGAKRLLDHRYWHCSEEMEVGDTKALGSLSIEATKAEHSDWRYPLGPRAKCLGYVIRGNRSVYIAGDTEQFPEMSLIGRDLDLALLPVWGWGPTLRHGHMNPYRAARALQLLRPRFSVPTHWGTFAPLGLGWRKFGFLKDPPHAFLHFASQFAPEVEVRIVPPGGSIVL
ncbi:MAG: MBL fold metallo-hydrolase, partial [Anaerolineales bacterium]|nr:MBL fold metallo-hydrolase [Anaerolineales bacterium]